MRKLTSVVVLLSFMLSLVACGGGGTSDTSATGDNTVQGSSSGLSNINYNWPANILGYKIIFTVEVDVSTGIAPGSEVVYEYDLQGSVKGTNPDSGNVYYPDSYEYIATKLNEAIIRMEYSGGSATEEYILTATSPTQGHFEYTGNPGDGRGDLYNSGRYDISGTGIDNALYISYVGDGIRPINGNVSGLSGEVTLETQGSNPIIVTDDGSFSFANITEVGANYDISVQTHPSGQTCEVINSGDSTNIQISVNCTTNSVGGSVSGLSGPLVLQNVSGDELTINSNGVFSFDGVIDFNEAYAITVDSDPFGQTCTLSNGAGTYVSEVNNLSVSCVDTTPVLTLGGGFKELQFNWDTFNGATYYQLLVNTDGGSGFTQVGQNITGLSASIDISVHFYDWLNSRYILYACNNSECIASNEFTTTGQSASAIGKISSGDISYSSTAISSDGSTLAVGSRGEDIVYIYTKSASGWTKQADLQASNAFPSDDSFIADNFGFSVALSSDGNTLAVGAIREDSDATGINGNQTSNNAEDSGAVYVFTRNGTSWSQQAYVKASNTETGDLFGQNVALSSDGNTLVVGTPQEGAMSGAAYVFTRSGADWSQQDYIKASNAESLDNFGANVALSLDGNTLVVSAPREGSDATGINGDQTNNNLRYSGAIYVFIRSGTIWSQQAYIKASNTQADDYFGSGRGVIALSSDGNTLAVAATEEDSNATGIDGDQTNNDATWSGAVYIFTRSGTNWSQQAYVKASSNEMGDRFGTSVSLSLDGNTLAVGARGEDGGDTGINGNQSDNACYDCGAAYIFTRDASIWSQKIYVKSKDENDYQFGNSISISGDSSALVVLSNSGVFVY